MRPDTQHNRCLMIARSASVDVFAERLTDASRWKIISRSRARVFVYVQWRHAISNEHVYFRLIEARNWIVRSLNLLENCENRRECNRSIVHGEIACESARKTAEKLLGNC